MVCTGAWWGNPDMYQIPWQTRAPMFHLATIASQPTLQYRGSNPGRWGYFEDSIEIPRQRKDSLGDNCISHNSPWVASLKT